MVTTASPDLLPLLEKWAKAEPVVCSAVLFGSRARPGDAIAPADGWSDVDLHIIVSSVNKILQTDWQQAVPECKFCLRVIRQVPGGVVKITVLFAEGEADIVLVPISRMRLASVAMKLGLHRRIRFISTALNAFANPIRYGYRFLKGERSWGPLYMRVATEMTGYRLSDMEIERLAEIFLCDQLYLLQKLERGELIASQRVLHRMLNETNLILLHELRVRRGELSIQQGRRLEQLATPSQLSTVKVNARLDSIEIALATWRAREGLESLMLQLIPDWKIPVAMRQLLSRYFVQAK